MPKETFYNLNEKKQETILKALKEEFETKDFDKVSVKSIVEKLGIARGSFYQYFESLEDAYFTILKIETKDIHHIFMKLLTENDFDFEKSLRDYGNILYDVLFEKETYNIYKNWYIAWNVKIERNLKDFKNKYGDKGRFGPMNDLDLEKIYFIKSVIHNIIYRNFYEGWDKDKFLDIYMKNIQWITNGISKERNN